VRLYTEYGYVVVDFEKDEPQAHVGNIWGRPGTKHIKDLYLAKDLELGHASFFM
jgi:hypothetical protein